MFPYHTTKLNIIHTWIATECTTYINIFALSYLCIIFLSNRMPVTHTHLSIGERTLLRYYRRSKSPWIRAIYLMIQILSSLNRL